MLFKENERKRSFEVVTREARPRGGEGHGLPCHESARLQRGAGDRAARGRLALEQAHPRLALWTLFSLFPALEQ